MKKILKPIMIVLVAVSFAFGLSACGNSGNRSDNGNNDTNNPPSAVHTHDYTEEVILPTCQAQGYTVHRCSCGDVYQDCYTDIVPHKGVGKCSYCQAVFNALIKTELPAGWGTSHGAGSSEIEYIYQYEYENDTQNIRITADAQYPAYGSLLGRYEVSFILDDNASWDWRIDMYSTIGTVTKHEYLTGMIETSELHFITPATLNIPFDTYSTGMTGDLASALDGMATIALHDIINEILKATEATQGVSLDNFGLINYS